MKLAGNFEFNETEKKRGEAQLVLLALLPALFVGLINFGIEAFWVVLLSVGTGVICDCLYAVLRKKKEKWVRESTLLVCLLYALILPPTLPWYCVVAGSAFALLLGKYAFSYDGDYFLNPVLVAKAFLLLSFAGPMGRFFFEGQAAKTPLESLMTGEGVNTMKLFLGNTAGSIGTTSTLAVLLGAAFLLWMDVIRLEIPLSILAGFLVIGAFFNTPVEGMNRFHYLVAECCSGGLLFGAFFMATDPVTLPKGRKGRIVLGLFIGIAAACLRFYGHSREGISYAILGGNLLLTVARRMEAIRKKGNYERIKSFFKRKKQENSLG